VPQQRHRDDAPWWILARTSGATTDPSPEPAADAPGGLIRGTDVPLPALDDIEDTRPARAGPGTAPSTPAPPTPPSAPTNRKKWSRAITIIRVDATAAERGKAVAGEICELAGVGPIPIAGVQQVLAEGSQLALVTTRPDGSVERVAHVRADRAASLNIRDPQALAAEMARTGRNVADLIHTGRAPTAHQTTALRWTSPTCTVDGCNTLACEIDHTTGWAITKTTKLGDLDPLCRYHHRKKTLHGWALVPGHGPRRFVAPDDPRHPNNHQG